MQNLGYLKVWQAGRFLQLCAQLRLVENIHYRLTCRPLNVRNRPVVPVGSLKSTDRFSWLFGRRTALINQIRGLLSEREI
jgi:hypothetical protein